MPGSFSVSNPVSRQLGELARAHRNYGKALLRALGLFPGQEVALMALAELGAQSQADLASRLRLDQSTMGKSLYRLERRGFVERFLADRDGRANEIMLSRKGKEVIGAIERASAELERALTSELSSEQRVQLYELLETARTSLGKQPTLTSGGVCGRGRSRRGRGV